MPREELNLATYFNAFASKVTADFPHLAGRFVIYNAPAGTLHGDVPEDKREKMLAERREKAEEFLRTHAARPHAYAGSSRSGYDFIDYIEEEMNRYNYRTTNDPYEREVFAAMVHELAHIVVPGADAAVNRLGAAFKENAAEAYSFLRQLQKYGSIKDQIDAACRNMAGQLMLENHTSHFSVPLLQELRRMSETYDIPAMNLTPVQAANMAFRLALLYTPSNTELRDIERIFRPVMLSFHKIGWESETFESCAEEMLANHGMLSGKAFAAGKAFLAPFLDARMDILQFGFEKNFLDRFKGEKWDDIRARIKARYLIEEAVTPQERLAREARDMAVFGFFDKGADTLIQYPVMYGNERNMAYLKRAQEAYIDLRIQQENGALQLSREEIIAQSRTTAEKSGPKTSSVRPLPYKF